MNVKKLISFSLFLFFISCDNEENYLLHVSNENKLEILTLDDKCGEWGGNEKIITIYRDNLKEELYADFIEKSTDCKNGKPPQIIAFHKKIKIDTKERKIILNIINELFQVKLNNEDKPSHSGIYNRIMLSDSSIYIKDFPSKKLSSFYKFEKILKSE